jgi:hypothetical protein
VATLSIKKIGMGVSTSHEEGLYGNGHFPHGFMGWFMPFDTSFPRVF